jgi:catechol 2,3-dioxygenase-like lactoylglutathione lyase family enzyme
VKLTHVRLLVDDYALCFHFYRDVLGLEVTFGDETSGYSDFATNGGTALALFDRREQAEAVELRPPGDEAVLIFGVENVDDVAGRLGAYLVGPPQSRAEWGIRFVHVRDPHGNLIEINQQIPMSG